MKVFYDMIDISNSKGNSIGIYNYSLSLLKELSKNENILLFVACNNKNFPLIYIDEINVKYLKINIKYPSILYRLYWNIYASIKLAKKKGCNIYFTPKGHSPGLFKRKKQPYVVSTIHDLIPFFYKNNFPNYFGFFKNTIVCNILKKSVLISNHIITISNFTSSEIHKNITNNNSNISVIHNGCNIYNSISYFSYRKDYIFSMTSILPHKNFNNLILSYKLYRNIASKPLDLIICGIDNNIIPYELKNYIITYKNIDDDLLKILYKNASLFLFIPLIEGFGFPPLEALSHKTKTLVSDIPVFRELYNNYVYFINPINPLEIAVAIQNTLNSKDLNEDSSELINYYNWETTGKKVYHIFNSLLNNKIILNET